MQVTHLPLCVRLSTIFERHEKAVHETIFKIYQGAYRTWFYYLPVLFEFVNGRI